MENNLATTVKTSLHSSVFYLERTPSTRPIKKACRSGGCCTSLLRSSCALSCWTYSSPSFRMSMTRCRLPKSPLTSRPNAPSSMTTDSLRYSSWKTSFAERLATVRPCTFTDSLKRLPKSMWTMASGSAASRCSPTSKTRSLMSSRLCGNRQTMRSVRLEIKSVFTDLISKSVFVYLIFQFKPNGFKHGLNRHETGQLWTGPQEFNWSISLTLHYPFIFIFSLFEYLRYFVVFVIP